MGYAVGQSVTLEGRFRLDRVPTDPEEVHAWAIRPDGQEIVLTAIEDEDEEGLWTATTLATMPGRWRFRFRGRFDGDLVATREDSFYVEPTPFTEP